METTTAEPQDIWWPSPDVLDDLIIEEIPEGFSLSAPDGTECSAWLGYYMESEERQEQFNKCFLDAIITYAKHLEETNGSPLEDSLGNEDARSGQTEEDSAGSV